MIEYYLRMVMAHCTTYSYYGTSQSKVRRTMYELVRVVYPYHTLYFVLVCTLVPVVCTVAGNIFSGLFIIRS